jgi:hypothetical protein
VDNVKLTTAPTNAPNAVAGTYQRFNKSVKITKTTKSIRKAIVPATWWRNKLVNQYCVFFKTVISH